MAEGRLGRRGGAGSQVRPLQAPQSNPPPASGPRNSHAGPPPVWSQRTGSQTLMPPLPPQPHAPGSGIPWSGGLRQGIPWANTTQPAPPLATGGYHPVGRPPAVFAPPQRPFGAPPGAEANSGTTFRPPQAVPVHVFRPSGGTVPPIARAAAPSLRTAPGTKELLVPFR